MWMCGASGCVVLADVWSHPRASALSPEQGEVGHRAKRNFSADMGICTGLVRMRGENQCSDGHLAAGARGAVSGGPDCCPSDYTFVCGDAFP